MRKVLRNTNEVIHVFSQQTQSEGRNQSGSIFFYYNKIYYNNYVHFASVFCILFILFSQDIISPSFLIVIFATSSLLVRPKKEYYNYKLVFYSGALSYGLYLWHQPIMYFNSLFWDKSFVNFLIIIFIIVIIP